MLNLFNFNYSEGEPFSGPLDVDTPLGRVRLGVFLDQEAIFPSQQCFIENISNRSSIHIWEQDNFHFELLKIDLKPTLPKGLKVDHCIALLCRFKNSSKKKHLLEVKCLFCTDETGFEVFPESGEGVTMLSWENQRGRITIGTEDEEYLISRAKNRQQFPLRLAQEHLIDENSIHFLDDGIQISLPPFLENEEGQVQFIISWVQGSKPDCSTWFAVDVRPEDILKQV